MDERRAGAAPPIMALPDCDFQNQAGETQDEPLQNSCLRCSLLHRAALLPAL